MESELLAGRYQTRGPDRRGGTGRVWRGFDPLLERAVAIKIVDWPARPIRRWPRDSAGRASPSQG
jgi:hypothetical protein